MKYAIKPRNILILFAVVSLILVAAYMAYRGYMNYQGYCWEEQRYISTEEKIRRTVEKIMEKYPPSLFLKENEKDGGNTSWKPNQPIFYKNFEHFVQENPDCCQWKKTTAFNQPEGRGPSFIDQVTGKEVDFVLVSYAVRFIKDGQYRSEPEHELFGLSSCAVPRSLNK